ncbi:MAG: hypothetical protein J7497_01770 [Chitinophagaceae bacterium]|nr:hypothetical protein [Chitinophagaceae bacterium]
MTDNQIKEQVKAIQSVTSEAKSSPEKAAAFLKAAGIASTPSIRNNSKGVRKN